MGRNYKVQINNPIEYKNLEEGENYDISILIKKKRDDQKIYLTYYYNKNPIEDLYEDLSESYIADVISNLTSILNGYVFLDYAQNPHYLENYTHPPIDLIESLNNVNKTGRKFYEFYREIKEILGTVRDLHFNIISYKTPKGKYIDKISACIPFKFYVDKDIKDNNETKLYIQYFENCAIYFDEKAKNYIKNKSDEKIPLKYINGMDPFDYIKNLRSNFWASKSPHGDFTFKKSSISTFNLINFPMTPDELSAKYEFETYNEEINDFIKLDYYIFVPNIQTVNKLYSNKLNSNNNILQNYNEDEFNKFFDEEMKNYMNNINKPNIFEMLEKFFEKKGILKEKEKEKKIKWDFEEKDEFKCRFDQINNVNVFLQTTFNFKNTESVGEVIINCAKLFFSNKYPIIGIENFNGGGLISMAQVLHQLIQIKTQDRTYFSGRKSDLYKKEATNLFQQMANIETCKPYNDIDDLMNGIIDDYSTEDKNITHHRTKIFDQFLHCKD